jgi:hypothetical protein
MNCKPLSLTLGFAAGILSASLMLSAQAMAQATVTQAPETYQPGQFYPPYYGGGGGGGGYGGWGWGMGGWGVGSTAAGSYYTGLGNAIRSQGQFNLDTSAAAINMTEAERRQIENSKLWTETYFEKRRINQAYRDSQRRPAGNSETWIRLAQAGTPQRLSPSDLDPVTGRVNWPPGLLNEVYAADRQKVDELFADRALAHGAIGPQAHAQITTSINAMLATLKSLIRQYETNQYIASRNFLNSLAFEASSPPRNYSASAELTPPAPRQ